MDDRFHQCFKRLVTQNSCFAVYREPGKKISWVASNNIPQPKPNFDGKTGFWMAPFQADNNHPFFVITPDFESTETGFKDPTIIPEFRSYHHEIPKETSRVHYELQLEKGINRLQQGELDKFIFSRCLHTLTQQPISEIFLRLEVKYPNALIFYVNHPIYGAWMGATPETLFEGTSTHGKTQSLAGTQAINSSENWGKKERKEQAFVTDYIANQLSKTGISFQSEGPITKPAGPVQHLLSTFNTSPLDSTQQAIDMVTHLHPTPAVCGIPTEFAKRLIEELEQESRGYYTGFLGRFSSGKDFHFFVNLRCMQVFENLLVLRLGGGITADSSVSAEWEETQLKAKTLLQALR